MENKLYNFSKLRSWLIRKGYTVDKTSEWQVIRKDLTREELSQFVEFSEEAAIYTDENNHQWKGYVYKKYFSFSKDKPRMHLYDCSTLINYGRGEYVFTNSDTIICYDTSNENKEHKVENPKMCRHCIKVRKSLGWQTYKDAKDFIKKIYNGKKPSEEYFINKWGYTKDWQDVRYSYIRNHNYKCEKCGIAFDSPLDLQYLNVYHKNGDKSDNKEDNLICKCIGCYSKDNNLTKTEKQILNSYNRTVYGMEIESKYDKRKSDYKQPDLFDDLFK